MASIFTRIIKGELPCYKIYENEFVISFLALDQVAPGHTLVIPKKEVDYFLEVPEPWYTEVFKATKLVGKALHKAFGRRVCTTTLGFEVPHFHHHLIPLVDIGGLNFKNAKRLSPEEMKSIQQKIVSNLEAP